MSKFIRMVDKIEARQFHGPSVADVDQMVAFDDWMTAHQGEKMCRYRGDKLIVPTLFYGELEAKSGDWVFVCSQGNLYVVDDAYFKATYEAVE